MHLVRIMLGDTLDAFDEPGPEKLGVLHLVDLNETPVGGVECQSLDC